MEIVWLFLGGLVIVGFGVAYRLNVWSQKLEQENADLRQEITQLKQSRCPSCHQPKDVTVGQIIHLSGCEWGWPVPPAPSLRG